jgi:hypothetical protein
MSINIFN